MSDFVCLDGRASDFVLLRLPEHVRGLDGLGGTSPTSTFVAGCDNSSQPCERLGEADLPGLPRGHVITFEQFCFDSISSFKK
jgi:hypothetical protein